MAPTITIIRNYYTHQEYYFNVFGEEMIVTVTRTPTIIRQWIHNVHFLNRFSSHPLVVGFMWTVPGYYTDSRSEIYYAYGSQVDTVQLCNSQDAKRLEKCGHRLKIEKLLDMRMFVKDSIGRSMKRSSFEEIVEECMGYRGVRLDPEVSMSDWSIYILYDHQILQASIDVYVCSKLGVRYRLWEV